MTQVILEHTGTKRHSGRYKWGSGQEGYQRDDDLLHNIDQFRKSGATEKETAEAFSMSIAEIRDLRSMVSAKNKAAQASQALRLKETGMSDAAISREMGISDHTVKSLLDPARKVKMNITAATADVLRDGVKKVKYLDVGLGTETILGISRSKLNLAVRMLEREGYSIHYTDVTQVGTGKETSLKVLAAPGVTASEVYKHKAEIRYPTDYSEDGGRSYSSIQPPQHVARERVFVRYGDEGGSDKDGAIQLRRGVEDIDLGSNHYSQVRIGVGGTHFMKGMAIYADDIPNGFDIVYNTNKKSGTPDDKVFKPIKEDPEDPFGSTVRQKKYIGKDGKEHLSALNSVNDEGQWGEWSRTISSQILSKQLPSLAKKQLNIGLESRQEEYDEIMALTNPVIKKRLLDAFSDGCDSAAVHLKAAALPRQASYVIIPFNSVKENEVYAPALTNGESVVLIRHPHGGIFEIPELTVNNKNPEAKSILGESQDAIGIHPKVAQRLSGADFDGDAVLMIPNKDGNIRTQPAIKALQEFDNKTAYPYYEGMHVLSEPGKELKMGEVSNLITDMTIKGASLEEITRAVKHSMVVIDAPKHKLNYRQSYIDNGIAQLKDKYQRDPETGSVGAATLISRSSSEIRVPLRERDDQVVTTRNTNPETGEKIYDYSRAGETYISKKTTKKGTVKEQVVERQTISTKMAEAVDARSLSSGTRIENIYADYANSLKALANLARKSSLEVPRLTYSPSAREVYSKEVKSLNAKLNNALRNKPKERRAQLLANQAINAKRRANPDMEAKDLKRLKGDELAKARARTNAKKDKMPITDREWEAIQAGAVSHSLLSKIVLEADLDLLKIRAMPREAMLMSSARSSRAKSMRAAGSSMAEIAQALGVSVDTIQKTLES